MLLKFIKDVASGKSRAFYTAFTGFHYQLQDRVGELPAPQGPVQTEFLRSVIRYIQGTKAFCEVLFYGEGDMSPILTLDELRLLGESNGSRFFSLMLVSLIRYSLAAEPQIADSLVTVTTGVLPDAVVPAAERLSAALRDQSARDCDRIIVGILRQAIPDAADDPTRRVQFSVLLAAYAAELYKTTLNALRESAAKA